MLSLLLFPMAALAVVPHQRLPRGFNSIDAAAFTTTVAIPVSTTTTCDYETAFAVTGTQSELNAPSVTETIAATSASSATSIYTSASTESASSTESSSACSTDSPAMTTAPYGAFVKPKVLLWANDFELTFLEGYNFTTRYTGPMLESTFACTDSGEVCYFDCGGEFQCLAQATMLFLTPGIDLTQAYVFVSGTGGANPNYSTAGGVAISQYVIQWELSNMFLGSDLPANFSDQYLFSYGQDLPSKYPILGSPNVFELNEALIDRFYDLAQNLTYEDVAPALQSLRSTYIQPAAHNAPFLSKCDVVSAQIYWHGDVAGENVAYFSDIITSGAARPCHTNMDDSGRLAPLLSAAAYQKFDFERLTMIKAFSNFDRPPPQLTAFQSRFTIGESATEAGLRNAWQVVKLAVSDVLQNWNSEFVAGITAPNYVGDAVGTLGGTPPFVRETSAVVGSIQGT